MSYNIFIEGIPGVGKNKIFDTYRNNNRVIGINNTEIFRPYLQNVFSGNESLAISTQEYFNLWFHSRDKNKEKSKVFLCEGSLISAILCYCDRYDNISMGAIKRYYLERACLPDYVIYIKLSPVSDLDNRILSNLENLYDNILIPYYKKRNVPVICETQSNFSSVYNFIESKIAKKPGNLSIFPKVKSRNVIVSGNIGSNKHKLVELLERNGNFVLYESSQKVYDYNGINLIENYYNSITNNTKNQYNLLIGLLLAHYKVKQIEIYDKDKFSLVLNMFKKTPSIVSQMVFNGGNVSNILDSILNTTIQAIDSKTSKKDGKYLFIERSNYEITQIYHKVCPLTVDEKELFNIYYPDDVKDGLFGSNYFIYYNTTVDECYKNLLDRGITYIPKDIIMKTDQLYKFLLEDLKIKGINVMTIDNMNTAIQDIDSFLQ